MGLFRFIFASPLEHDREEYLSNSISEFRQEYQILTSHYVEEAERREFRKKWTALYREIKDTIIPENHPLLEPSKDFMESFRRLDQTILSSNEAIEKAEAERIDQLLSDIDGKSLDEQQRAAVLSDADRNLVLAGAGSGKTLTIAGKVKYLCEAKGISPSDILLIAFTRKAAEEMTERISGRLGLSVQATTFHKLGLDIITEASGNRPDVQENLIPFVRDYFETKIVNHPDEVQHLLEYFAYYLKIPADLDKYESLGDAYQHEKGADFETLQSKYQREKYLQNASLERREDRRTLQNEQVKSLEEVEIANFLFLHSVRYEYEKRYPFESEDPKRKAYRPDFYLPDHNLYLEHFGINKDQKLPWLSPIEEQKYLEDMKWKREFHKDNNTTLLETYSYYQSEGRLLEELEKLLKKHGVIFKEPDFTDIFRTVYAKESDKYFSGFIRLCSTFIMLFKSRAFTLEDLKKLRSRNPDHQKKYYINRTEKYKQIVAPILEAYNTSLKKQGAVDFSDMINQATELVSSGKYASTYKWIIIDEYQDISADRFRLVKALLDQTGARLLCVGDDWQSIYRFAGSDITLFTGFEKLFKKTKILRIEHTYRNSHELISAAGTFIQKNPLQYKKSLHSDKSLQKPVRFLSYQNQPATVLKTAMDEIISESDPDSTILLLGRTKFDLELVRASGLFSAKKTGQLVYLSHPERKVSFLTIHKSKGLEADNVILLNFQNSALGLPCKIEDDPLLEIVLTEDEAYPYAEERRLFYVAMTRTRNSVHILVDGNNPSEFYKEFQESAEVSIQKESGEEAQPVFCPICKTGTLKMRQNGTDGGFFAGCSNFPQCKFMISDISVLNSPKICPECGGFLLRRKYKGSTFYGCSNYPYCKYTEKTEEEIAYEKAKNTVNSSIANPVRYQELICPEYGGQLVRRTAKQGARAGKPFYGCSNYPKCRYIRNL
ncbi:MAG: UvrD-helicase domain-containing protein [Parasporobacterium sp.]|nr:UvrD-helicase domain-containing protein [Parasporobacterium sp.]